MTNSKRGGRVVPPLPLLLAFAFLACGIVLFGVVSFHSAKMTGAAASNYSSKVQISSSSISTDSSASTEELKQMVKSMHDQLKDLKASLPHTIQSQLKEHHEATKQQQQQQPRLPAERPRQQQQQPEQQPPRQGGGVYLPDHKVHHIGQARAACDKRTSAGISLRVTDKLVAPVVIVAHNRVHYLAKCLMTLLRYWSEDPSNAERFPLFVSVDGGDQATMQFAAALNFGAEVQVIHNLRDSSRCKPRDGYCNLSVHYHMLLQLFFECHKAPRLLFMEEDLEVAPDFFSYFAAFVPVLARDKSLLCVSAWNDHGQAGRALNHTELFRTDIFPGLGWMMTAELAKELTASWPNGYWDEYMREPKVRKGRQCIFPEVPRTHTFGKVGTSGGQFFDQHLAVMLLNKKPIDWSKQDLTQFEAGPFEARMVAALAAAQPLDTSKVDLRDFCAVGQPDHDERGDLLVRYKDEPSFKTIATKLHPMLVDLKGGPSQPGNPFVPRGSYKGVVSVRCRGRRLFIAPEPGSPAEPADHVGSSGSNAADSSSSSSSSGSDGEKAGSEGGSKAGGAATE